MRKILYFIVAHHNQSQLYRLVRTIKSLSPESLIVIHYDASSSVEKTRYDEVDNVFFIPEPTCVSWGNYSQVEMLINSLKWIDENLSFDWLVMISGQDYPINKLDKFERILTSSSYDAFFRYFKADDPACWPLGTSQRRYQYCYAQYPHFPYYYKFPEVVKKFVSSMIFMVNNYSPFSIIIGKGSRMNKIGCRRIVTPFSAAFDCYGGWDWFNLNRKSINYILDFVDNNEKFVKFYKRTHMASESFVHTILINAEGIEVANDACRYVHWGSAVHAASPEVIRSKDFFSCVESGQPFARKFDEKADSKVLLMIDRYLGIGH